MKRFFVYEISSISLLGLSLADLTAILQFIAVLLAVIAGVKALYNAKPRKK